MAAEVAAAAALQADEQTAALTQRSVGLLLDDEGEEEATELRSQLSGKCASSVGFAIAITIGHDDRREGLFAGRFIAPGSLSTPADCP